MNKILESLTHEQRRRLMHAFDNNFSQFVEYTDGKYIGVNIPANSNLKVDTQIGVWSTGEIQ